MTDAAAAEEDIEALFDLVYEEDADAVAAFMDAKPISPNVLLPLGGMPLLHAAVNSEVEKGTHDPNYRPTDSIIRTLLTRGSYIAAEYSGHTAQQAAHRAGLHVADAAFAEHSTMGWLLKGRRLMLGMTQAALAKQVGVTGGMICSVENGHRNLSRATADRVVTALGLTTTERQTFQMARDVAAEHLEARETESTLLSRRMDDFAAKYDHLLNVATNRIALLESEVERLSLDSDEATFKAAQRRSSDKEALARGDSV
jgi:transcriptional regulator with XRE-family HTH domain